MGDPTCFAHDSPIQVESSYGPPEQTEIFGIRIDSNGEINRLVPEKKPDQGEFGLKKAIQSAIANNDQPEVLKLLANSNISNYEKYTYAGVQNEKTPFAVTVKWHTKLYYVILHDNMKFVKAKKASFHVPMVLNQFYKAPYADIDVSGNRKALAVTFLAPKSIPNRDCEYTYNLNVVSVTKVNGAKNLRTPISIDPENQNDGDTPPH